LSIALEIKPSTVFAHPADPLKTNIQGSANGNELQDKSDRRGHNEVESKKTIMIGFVRKHRESRKHCMAHWDSAWDLAFRTATLLGVFGKLNTSRKSKRTLALQ
jgi:hypothetical protein